MNLYMSPYNLNVNSSGNRYANVFIVYNDGHLNNANVNDTNISVRPIPFYNSYIRLRLNIAELRYKILSLENLNN